MRTANFYLRFLWIAAMITVFVTVACKKERLINLTDGIVLNVNTDIVDTPVSISFVNDRPGGAIPDHITIDVLGDGAPDIYTLTGDQEFTVIQGLVNIGIDKSASPSPEDPIEFSLLATAPGFLPAVHKVVITSDQSHQHVVVTMVEEDDLPEG
ncbi:MAG: hypothetical protein KDC44_09765, partial [Phaeodactylibacter sp.]|nr:hypothetical protein [Phaeodactylibacter sp.]